jgi:hypothetical protein
MPLNVLLGKYNPFKNLSGLMSNVSQILSSVVSVMGHPASICCRCRAENPKLILSSWL